MLTSWRRGYDCCRWTGVTCSNQSGHVVKLDLNCYHGPACLVGQISPSLLSLEYLEYLDLSWNSLEGPNSSIPEFLGSMKNVRYLDLSYIPFSGRVPSLFSNLSNLEYLALSGTFFSGSVPPQLGNLSNLKHLDLSNMQHMYSTDISWLTQLHLVEHIDMSNTHLSKIVDLPSVVNMISTLKHIILINCSLPTVNQSLTRLNLTNLQELYLSQNYLNHPISSCWFWNVTSIEQLFLSETYLYGPFPNALGTMTSLRWLDFTYNGNAATMAVELKDLCALETLWLYGSLSSGNITELVENLPRCPSNKLGDLILRDNNMTGTLPYRVGHLSSLVVIDLSNNSITGAIPPGIGSCTSLSWIDLSNNHLTETIPLETGNYTSLSWLDLSNNHLTGTIPLGTGNYTSLYYLDLSNNHLIGTIPLGTGNYTRLYYLDLSNNNLTGSVHPMIGNILDLSYNNLTGRIPPGRQLDTLYAENPSIYDGNNGLCGPPLRRNCSGNNASGNGNQMTSEKFSEPMFFYFGLGSGFTAGLWAVVCATLFNKTWRIAYFRLFDRVYDTVFVFVVVTWGRFAREATTG